MSFLIAAAVAFGVGGCGSSSGDDSGPAAQTTTNLRVTFDPDGPGGAPAKSATVVCVAGDKAPAGTRSVFGDCAAIDQLPADFGSPTPPNTACTEIFGGPEVVRISGTLRGHQLNTKLTRTDGCQIDRFEPFMPILEELFPSYRPGGAIAG